MSLTNVEYSIKEQHFIVLGNLFKLFERRNYILNSEKFIDKYVDSTIVNTILKIDSDLDNSKKPISYQVYIVGSKINSISQGSPIDEFLNNDIEIRKFLIVPEANKKIFKQSREQYLNTEIFSFDELLEDIPSKDIIPEHQLLSNEEKEELLTYFQNKNFKRIFEYDIMSRYYGAKPNDIFRIVRDNTSSGKGIDYRLVIPGKYELIF